MKVKMDSIGRIFIPTQLCHLLKWERDIRLEVDVGDDTNSITLREAWPSCVICRKDSNDAVKFGKVFVCPKCINMIKQKTN